jgi:hypothetical protein
MPSFADVYNNAPAPSVHSTRPHAKSTHPTSTSHIPADAKPLNVRQMSSSRVGMGRTRGTERGSKPEEAPVGPEFASRTQDAAGSAPLDSPGGKKGVLAAYDRRPASLGSPPRDSSTDENDVAIGPDTTAPSADKSAPEDRERRGSITNFLKKVF